jgi:hypothetical protein
MKKTARLTDAEVRARDAQVDAIVKEGRTARLTDAEIRDGMARLMTSALMTSPKGSIEEHGVAADWAAQFKVGDVAPPLENLAEAFGTNTNVASVIHDLAVALVTKRLCVEEIFRLGTSAEAMRLFESECWEWNNPLSPNVGAKAEEAGA